MKVVPVHYESGGTWGICDRCGFKVRHRTLRREWTGLLVCPDDWDPRPYDIDPPVVWPEGVPVPDARPEPPNVFIGDGSELREDGGTELREDGSEELRD